MICCNIDCGHYAYEEDNNCTMYFDNLDDVCSDFSRSRRPKRKKKQTPKTEKAKMNEFDNALTNANNGTLTTKINTAKEAAKASAIRTKNTVVRVKVGRIAIAAIKSAIKKTPGVPVYAKMLLDSDYADIVIGAVVPIIVPMITANKKAIRLSEDVNIAGGVAIADKLTFIDDFVAQVIAQVSSAVGPDDLTDETAKKI